MTWPDPSVNWSGSPRGILESNSVPSSNLPYNVCRNRVKMAVEDLFFFCLLNALKVGTKEDPVEEKILNGPPSVNLEACTSLLLISDKAAALQCDIFR